MKEQGKKPVPMRKYQRRRARYVMARLGFRQINKRFSYYWREYANIVLKKRT